MNQNEQFIILDNSYLPQMAELYKSAFEGEVWHDDWSDEIQLAEYIKDISCSFNALNYGLLIDGTPAYHFYKKNGFSELSSHVSFYKKVQM